MSQTKAKKKNKQTILMLNKKIQHFFNKMIKSPLINLKQDNKKTYKINLFFSIKAHLKLF